jgi:hypothetical protein
MVVGEERYGAVLLNCAEKLSEHLLANKVRIFRPRAHPCDTTAGRNSQSENLLSVNTTLFDFSVDYNYQINRCFCVYLAICELS